jgi:hypothetical protein
LGFNQLRLSGSQTLSGDYRWITALRIAKDRSHGVELQFVPHATVRAHVCVAAVGVAVVRASFTTTTTHDIDFPEYHAWSNRLQTGHGVQEPFHLVTLLFLGFDQLQHISSCQHFRYREHHDRYAASSSFFLDALPSIRDGAVATASACVAVVIL